MLTIHGPVILDLNTQRDLFAPDGVYPVVDAPKFADTFRKIFAWAHRLKVPVISTRLRYLTAPGQRGNNRLLCHPQGPGYGKLPATLLRRRSEMPLDCGTSIPVEGFHITQQYIFDLPSLNPFECPRLDRILSESTADLWVLIGGPLEYTLRTAVLGLLARRHKVAVVSDAIGQWDPYEGDMALRQVESKNVEWFTAASLLERYAKPLPVHRPGIPGVVLPPRKARTPAASPNTPAKKGSPQKSPKREYRLT